MKTKVLIPLTGSQVTEPGTYICVPMGFQNFLLGDQQETNVWLVELYLEPKINKLIYRHPEGEEYCVESCGHTFFRLEN